MAGEIGTGADALTVDPKDHVATALRELKAGQTVTYRLSEEVKSIVLADDIPFGHKLAITDIPQGEQIRKYGEVIGRATASIKAGQHVHVHNVEGIRGRGDQAAQGGQGA
ncbi:UxaA family hydrolase [Paenibacillus thermotolerans]|uniref:UxaA family hydrolase n=1 Tax=Paenibacillus thermotolerans TaxID=3027807 RepID=UPI002367EDE4|nr:MULTISPECIES: UxaA family hydrolase [unclassified Paenibacillus]